MKFSNGDWSLVFRQAPALWVTVLVIIPAVLLATYLVYRRENTSPLMRLGLLVLRASLFFILVLIIYQPVLSTEYTFRRESNLPILIDDSLSMGFSVPGKSGGKSPSRLSAVENALLKPDDKDKAKPPEIIRKLAETYKLRLYTFGTAVSQLPADAKPGLEARSDGTAIGNALLDALKDVNGHTTGIILVSDGQNNAGLDPLEAARILEDRNAVCPIYTVAPVREEPIKDLELSDLKAPVVAIARDFISFEFSVRATGLKEGETVTASLSESPLDTDAGAKSTGPAVAEQILAMPADGAKAAVTLKYKPDKPGRYVYTLSIPVQKGEIVAENNSLTHYVNVIDNTIRVLYVETYPRWEYRRLKNSLIRDRTMKAAVLLLDADPDFPQESSPGIAPVFEFPRTKKELFEYDVILWGDADPMRLADSPAASGQIVENLKSFIEDMGGGIGFIAGAKYNPDSFRGTFMTELLPVALEDQSYAINALMREDETIKDAFKMKLTAEGKAEPLMQLDDNALSNQRLWEDSSGLPGMIWFFPVKKPKPGARVLAVHPLDKNSFGERALIAVQNYGKGRAFFSAFDETWRWCLLYGDKYFYAFWSNALRYLRGSQLTGDKHYQLATDRPNYTMGDRVRVFARVYDPDYNPLAASSYSVSLIAPPDRDKPARPNAEGGRANRVELALAQSNKTGSFEGSYVPTVAGNYYLETGPKENPTIVAFNVRYPSREYENPGINVRALQALAEKTKGEFLYLDQINTLAQKIKPSADILYTETTEKDLWDSPLVFLAFLLIITAEWIIRKLARLI
ncbi:MAG: hypothetical protein WC980_04740 [Candidatus Brocadiia bacterium]